MRELNPCQPVSNQQNGNYHKHFGGNLTQSIGEKRVGIPVGTKVEGQAIYSFVPAKTVLPKAHTHHLLLLLSLLPPLLLLLRGEMLPDALAPKNLHTSPCSNLPPLSIIGRT